MTKIYCDIADLKIIKQFNKKKIVKGFTTNPSLMRKAGAKDYSLYTKSILKITKKPVSCEVFADDINSMIKQGKEISKWGKNLYVKVPITNSKGKYMSKVIRNLNNNNIKLNITAVYTSMQTRQILRNINKKKQDTKEKITLKKVEKSNEISSDVIRQKIDLAIAYMNMGKKGKAITLLKKLEKYQLTKKQLKQINQLRDKLS